MLIRLFYAGTLALALTSSHLYAHDQTLPLVPLENGKYYPMFEAIRKKGGTVNSSTTNGERNYRVILNGKVFNFSNSNDPQISNIVTAINPTSIEVWISTQNSMPNATLYVDSEKKEYYTDKNGNAESLRLFLPPMPKMKKIEFRGKSKIGTSIGLSSDATLSCSGFSSLICIKSQQ